MEQGAFNTGKGVPCGTNVEGHVHLENERVLRLAKQIIEVWQAQQQGSEQSLAAQCQDCTQSPSNMQNVGFTKLASPQPPSPQSPVVGSLNDVFNKNFSSFSGSMDAFSGQFRRQFIGQPVCESGYGRRQSQSEILRQYIGQQEQISQSLDDFNDGLPNDVPVGQQSSSGINEYAMYQLFRQQMLGQQGAQQQPVQRQQEVDNLANLFQELNVGLSSSTSSNVPFVEAHMDPAFGVQQGVGSRFVQPQQVQQQQQQQQEVEPLIDLTSQVPVGEGLGGSGRIGPSLVPREIKLERPSTFEGKHEQLENFLFEIQQYIDIVGLGTGARACQFFVSYLKGDAATWWRTYSMSKSRSGGSIFENLDLDTIVEELRQQFSDVDKLMHVRDKLFKLRQFGKVSHYTAVFRRLQIELGDERLDDENAKYLYIRGLKQEVQNQVLLHRPDTFEDVVFCAERAGQAFELASGNNHSQRGGFGNGRGKFGGNRGGFQGKSRGNFGGYRGGFGRQQFGGSYQQQRGGYTQYNDHSNRGSGPMVLGSLEQQLLALSGQQKQQKQQKSSVVCWYCNKSGHTKKQCFKWQRDNGVSGGSGQQSGDVASQLALILSNLQKSGQQQPQQPQQQNKDKGQQSKN